MATQWTPYTIPGVPTDRMLMSDGTVRDLPAMEQTVSTRPRYRIAGTTVSFPKSRMWENVAAHVQAEYGVRPVKLLSALANNPGLQANEDFIAQKVSDKSVDQMLQALAGQSTVNPPSVIFMKKFEHAASGAAVCLTHTLMSGYGGRNFTVTSYITHPLLHFNLIDSPSCAAADAGGWGAPAYGSMRTRDEERQAYLQMSQVPTSPHALNPGVVPGHAYFRQQTTVRKMTRQALIEFIKRVHAMENTAVLKVPAFINGIQDNTVAEIEFTAVNDRSWTDEGMGKLWEFLNPSPALKDVSAAFQQLQVALSRSGFVLDYKESNAVIADLTSGNVPDLALTFEDHGVYFNPATGETRMVCSKNHFNNDVEQAWEVARFKAEMSGGEDEFRQFATVEALKMGIRQAASAELDEVRELKLAIASIPERN